MPQHGCDRRRNDGAAHAMTKSQRRPLHYRIGTVVRTSPRRMDVACLDGRVTPIRLAARTLFTLGGQRLSGADVLRPGLDVRVAGVDSSGGMTAVVVELRARAHSSVRGGCPAVLPPSLEVPKP